MRGAIKEANEIGAEWDIESKSEGFQDRPAWVGLP